ncbi:flavin reductase, partial [Streptomyces lavendulae]
MTELDPFTDYLDGPVYVVAVAVAVGAERAGCLVGFASQCSIDPPRFIVWLSV